MSGGARATQRLTVQCANRIRSNTIITHSSIPLTRRVAKKTLDPKPQIRIIHYLYIYTCLRLVVPMNVIL